MSLLVQQQIFEIIKKKNKILIVFAKNFNGDSLASAISLTLFLKKLEKDVSIVCDDFKAPEKFKFLPLIDSIKPQLKISKKFIINLDITKTKVEDLSYQVKEDRLEIYINPKDGEFKPEDVTAATTQYGHDLIFVVDAPDLECLGRVYEDNADFFYQTPIINIDHSAENENFGQINLVDLTANSTSGIIFSLFENNLNILDEDLATVLYTGIVVKTNSFKSTKVTPQTLNTAAQLVAAGARREEVVKNLFRTYSLFSLKLWGRALARLKDDFEGRLIWTIMSQDDFIKTNTNEDHIVGIVEELMFSLPNVEIAILIYQKNQNDTSVLVYTKKNIDAMEVIAPLGAIGNKNKASLLLSEKNLTEAEEEIIKIAKGNLKIILA